MSVQRSKERQVTVKILQQDLEDANNKVCYLLPSFVKHFKYWRT